MIHLAILDCNDTREDDNTYREITSVVGGWLLHEMQKAGVEPVPVQQCDVLLLVHAGEVDWADRVRVGLGQYGIIPDAGQRAAPYIITGGAIDTAPFTALRIADALAIGEAYTFVRQLLTLCKTATDIQAVREWITAYPHAIEQGQLEGYERDVDAPYLLREAPSPLATPDEYVDWGDMPPVMSDDKVWRLLASKGCHLKCAFCNTSYRQSYRIHNQPDVLVEQMRELKAQRQHVSLITNDAAVLPFFGEVLDKGQLQFQSMTIKALQDPAIRQQIEQTRMKIIRVGVEGLSERIRQAVLKPVKNEWLLELVSSAMERGQQMRLFYIVGLPYEDDVDWMDFRSTFMRLQTYRKGRIQLKMTAFNPQGVTPLGYFWTDLSYMDRYLKTQWQSSHVQPIRPRGEKRRMADMASCYDVTPRYVYERLMSIEGGTVDLAPSLNEAKRMTWEIIDWPLSVEQRWRVARHYQRSMNR